MDIMYYIGLDVHKETISFCVKDASGQVHQAGKTGPTRRELDHWIETPPQPRIITIDAPIDSPGRATQSDVVADPAFRT
jgi:transposase